MPNSRQVALSLPLFVASSCALPILPIHSSGPSPAVCLAVLAAVSLGLLLLVLVKRVYIRRRRANAATMTPSPILPLPAGSTSAIVSVDSAASRREKAGFVVGFFGSPAVEIQCALEEAEWREHKRLSFTYQIHTDSRRHRVDYPSVLDITRRHNYTNYTSPRALIKSPLLREPRSFDPPTFPDKAYAPPPPRRFSLPTMNRSVVHESQRRRHSSLKSARSRRSVISSPGSPSLRIVDVSPRLDIPTLPLSPQSLMTSPAPSSNSPSQSFSPKFSRLSRSFMRPLPPLPFSNSPSSTAQRVSSIQISHPYALAPHPRKGGHTSPPSQTELKLPPMHRSSNINFVPLELTPSGPALSPTLTFQGPPPVTSVSKPKIRVRVRRSPAIGIGPSPLRTMILPDSTDGELSSHAAQIRVIDPLHSDARDRPASIHSLYASAGGRLGGSELETGSGTYAGVIKGHNVGVLKARRRHSSISSRCSSTADEDDPSVLLGIIRELVEETSEWDPSNIFMSQNFKTLLQESGVRATSARGGSSTAEANRPDKPSGFTSSESNQSARSTEVDLGLLGLDYFPSGSCNDARSTHSVNMVSFWEEDNGERSGVVGLAW
ncbi:hypothetical protein B0H15DRAFT_829471 [Mycena belliarum]|uniref:Uncharacterized protein n=1 Tax=Mycena belliarum TaxID=1033014 RepID=A0AAD6U8W4_9AGAR|nr:hypothetical protein B0H15DRAFT_829471 [Mycena belliae]